MRATAISGMLGGAPLDFFASCLEAAYKVHKLTGSILFRLLVYSLLTHRQASLRVLEGVFHSYGFQRAAGLHPAIRKPALILSVTALPPFPFLQKAFRACRSYV